MFETIRPRRLALLEGVIAGVFFGTAAIFVRFLGSLDVFAIAFWRLMIAIVALLVILLVLRMKVDFAVVRRNLRTLGFLGLFLGLHFILFIAAVKDTTILNATVLVNTTPIFAVVVSSFLFRLRPSKMALLGLMISFLGVSIIAAAEATTGNVYSDPGSSSLKGDLEAVLASVVEAFYLNIGKGVRSRMNILPIMLLIYAFTALAVVVVGLPFGGQIATLPVMVAVLLPLLGLGLLPTAIAHTLYFSSLSGLKSFETATLALIEPIGATILGIAILSEYPAPFFVAGALTTLVGILFVSRYES